MKTEPNRKIKKNNARLKFSLRYYCLAGLASLLWRFVMRVSVKKSRAFKSLKGGFLIVANHSSPYDMISAVSILFPKRQNFVVAENMLYHSAFFNRVLGKFGAIMKKQYVSDFSCVKSIKRYIDAGVPVLICPEGKVSDCGVTQPLVASTGKLVKWLNVPVVSFTVRGCSLMRPKWAHTFRRGKSLIECDVALTADQVSKLSAEQINGKLFKAIYNNDHIYQQWKKLKFKGKALAEGLEKILYKCPACGAEFEIESAGDILHCKACGNTVRYGADGVISPADEKSKAIERIDLWYGFERESLKTEIESGGFKISAKVSRFVGAADTRVYEFRENGTLELNTSELTFTSEDGRKLKFEVTNAPTLVSVPGVSVTVYGEDGINRFDFTEKPMSTKFAIAVSELAKPKSAE